MLDVVVVWLVWMRWVARQDFRREHLQADTGAAS